MTRTGQVGTRTVIVEDHQLFAESLEIAMTVEGYDIRRMPVPDASVSVHQMVTSVLRHRPRIVLLDLDLGTFGDGVRLINPIARGGANVVVVTGSLDPGRWGECVWHGARQVLAKTRPLNEILAVVRRLSQGLNVMEAEERERLLRHWHEQRREVQQHRERLDRLTPRERQVLSGLVAGQQVRDIARASVVSEATVRTQVKSILAKLEVSSQIAAVGLARQARWQPPEQRVV
ncbi:response regulator transcription factor [Nocardioides zeae]|uniref:Response regulator transcription factor n=1 Tax=Nocardioides imazamoxiresistens TaxID=3231893 RepID=A0ABU3PTH2_9ACTN|nr:response regulator transcription factor [Nocardioides zeae]MDT9592540.1 response regulator transcription factor [Nocardioides zeae]